jgi:hypothetical protein
MMLRREVTLRDRSQPGVLRRRNRAGPTFLAAFAGLAVVGVGTAAAALAGVHSGSLQAGSLCATLPAGPSSPPPGPTPSLSPGGTAKSGSRSGSANSAAPAATQLCLSVTAATSTVQPGQPARYTIDVQPTGGAADDVTVQISATPSSFPAPAFSICGAGDGTATCALGKMRANQTTEVQAQDAVPSSASPGNSVTLHVTVTGVASGATTQGSVSGIASVKIVAPPKSPPPSTKPTSPTHHSSHSHGHGHGNGNGNRDSGRHSGGSGSDQDSGVGTNLNPGLGSGDTLPTGGLSPLTGLTGTGSGADPSNLFPTISPSPGTTPAPGGSPAATPRHAPYHPTSVADILPLNTGQVGGQVAGLVVLALGVIIAVVRVSLRKPRTQHKQ